MHIPETMAHTGLAARPRFMPVVGPYYKSLAAEVRPPGNQALLEARDGDA